MKTYVLEWNGHRLELGRRTAVMGIVNVTPDSFSDGGHFFDLDAALAQAKQMVNDGADIIDIGGESTRPYSEAVSPEEEARRVIPVIEKLAGEIPVPISIDTTKASVAQKALDAGAAIINDISALRTDPEIASVAAKAGVPLMLMHMKGTPKDMQVNPVYDDLTGEVTDFLQKAMDQAVAAGVSRPNIIVDPGIGFGKTIEHNLFLLRHLGALSSLDAPILVGSSRKFFIRSLLTKTDREELSPLSQPVETGTQATVAAAVLNGAHIVRVHNVANTRATVTLIDAVRHASITP